MPDIDNRVHLEYIDQGIFDVKLKVAGDLLVFNMPLQCF